ncbi:hypothetical protein AXK57_01595 [Tsukamurella pulmonis]|uniref:hypothetical protein n=1 Tax=Tsukamurella pulmonis TaxID=47312 RepID=UPI00079226C0|nr:hypothetical protein [Tsukamurella pulmonis]KXP12963.1 hypothetical protein AXK57_01595 [Tsukamurella pulmonis]RDH09868.1 hypothetical protein DVB88_20095 [Tsukamurella pulmonis]
MHAAVRRPVSRRYAGASLALVAAAAIAVAPVTASVGAVTAPASTVLVNPAKLVSLQAQVAGSVADFLPRAAGPVATAAATAPTWGWGDVTFVADTLREAFQQVQASLAGEYGGGVQKSFEQAFEALSKGSIAGAYRPIGGLVETTTMIAMMAVLFPVAGEFNPKLGALGKGLDAAFPHLIPIGQSALALATRLPYEVLAAGEAIVKSVLTGDVTKIGAAVASGVAGIGKFIEANLSNASTGLIPNLVKAGSAVLGEMLPKLPASAQADAFAARAAVAAAPVGMPAFDALFEAWKAGYEMFVASWKGDQWTPGVAGTIADALARLAKGDPAGAIGDVTDKAKALSIIVLLGGVLPITDLINPYLGPIGTGLTNSQADFIGLGNSALAVLFDTPGKVVAIGQNLVTALLSGDPAKALTGLTADIGALTTFLNDRLFVAKDNPFDNAVFPGLANIGKNILDAFKPAAPAAPAAPAEAASVAKSAEVTVAAPTAGAPAVATPATGAVEVSAPTVPSESVDPAVPSAPADPVAPTTPEATTPEATTPEATTPEPPVPAEPTAETPAETVEAPAETVEAPATGGAEEGGTVEAGESDDASGTGESIDA